MLRLASILWRLRRATIMETGLFEIQAQQLHDYPQHRRLLPNSRDVVHAVFWRVLMQRDLRLIALNFIAERPRHGYGIIKLVQEKTADWYSPSAGIVYPALGYLQEEGYVTASIEGSKKLYAITSDGLHCLKVNRDLVKAVLDRVTALGERVSRSRPAARDKTISRRNLPPLVEAAFDHLRKTVSRRLEDDAEAEAHLVEIIAGADAKLRRK